MICRRNIYSLSVLVSLALLWYPGQYLFAHGAGQSFEQKVGSYIADVGYDVLALEAGEPVRFDFLLRPEAGEIGDITDVDAAWVRIVPKGNGVTYVGTLAKSDLGLVGMTFTFPQAGSYELTARFLKDQKTLVEATFPLTVQPNSNPVNAPEASRPSLLNLIAGLILGIVIGFGASAFIHRKRAPQAS